jgi:pimeloyl-ACP methyl ester carboxylesterase
MDGLRHEYVHVNNLRMHCAVAGEGPLMLMLHGFPEFWYSWRHQIPAMSRRFKVAAPDMRGYNQTEKPRGVANYRLERLMEDVAALIRALGYEKAVLVAHDWGGGVAWPFAARYPGMVDRLAILNCPPPGVLLDHLRRNPAQLRRSYYMFLFQLPLLPELALRLFDYRLIEKAFRGWAVDKAAFSDRDIRMFKEAAAKPGALTGGINYYRAAMRGALREELKRRAGGVGDSGKDDPAAPRVKCPTLVIWAEEDRALGKELTYDFHREVDAPLDIRYIPRCSHWVQQERPEEVNAMLEEWLADYPEKRV